MEEVSQDRLELALRASNEGIWDWVIDDDSSDNLYYSDRTLGFLGVSRSHAPHIFNHPEPWLHEDDIDFFKKQLTAVMKKNGSNTFVMDCRYERPDGVFVWLRIRGVAVRDEEGKLERLAGSMIDISRRKKAESELEEERHRLLTLIENVPVNVYFKDANSRFVMANTATAVKLGCRNVEELIGKCDHDFFDVRHADKSRADEELIMVTGEQQQESLEQEIWEGKEDTWVITSKTPWRDRKGNIRGVFGVTNDVTSLVKTQRQLMEMTYQLTNQNKAIEEELQLAHEIQLSMIQQDQVKSLPENPTDSCVWQANFAYRYAPVSGMAGDFYQVIPLEDDEVGLFMCDVMGHGVRSALIVSMIRGLMEKERASATSPECYLYGLNQGLVSILRRAGVTIFATAFYAVIDLKSKTLKYANAGHPSPLLLGKEGVSRLSDHKKVTGPALGLVEECAYAAGELSFDQFEKLVLFTDGIYETENAEGEEMGISRMLDAIQPGREIEEDLDGLLSATREFAGDGEFGDDVCLLGVKLNKL